MSDIPKIIRTENLTRKFDALIAVDHLNLEIAEGEIFALVGPDGAGKTTTMRMLCGLMHATEGKAIIAGHDVALELNAVKDQIGYMAQRFGLYTDLTVAENMRFYSDLFGVTGPVRDELTAKLLRMTRMDPFQKRLAGKLSGGMKQKLALMCTLLHTPRILFLDEPTNGVDPVSRRDFWAILYDLVRSGLTVFVSTAYLDEAERANRVAFMDHGRIIRCDTPAALKKGLDETCYRVRSSDNRALRERLANESGVLTAEPSGADLHLFLKPGTPIEPLASSVGFEFHTMVPSLEDAFIALIRKEEAARAA